MTENKSFTLKVRLKPSESSATPLATNYANLGIAQRIAYIDFGFIEPAQFVAIASSTKNGHAFPKGIEGRLVTRVAMEVAVLARLHQQIQKVLVGMSQARQNHMSKNKRSVKEETET